MNNENIAFRQIIVNKKDNSVSLSCIEDCLAEEIISLDQSEGEVNKISEKQFEDIWSLYTQAYIEKWHSIKNTYSQGQILSMRQCYIYPQGMIVKKGNVIGICDNYTNFKLNEPINVVFIGTDETNMWLKVRETDNT